MLGKSTRERFMFWLDLAREEDFIVADMITHLKNSRRFTATIRDGIRLICDLRRGRLDVLFELFPLLEAKFIGGVEADFSLLEGKLDRIEALVADTRSNGSNGNGLKPLLPMGFDDAEEDDDLVLEIKKDTSTDAVSNFLSSVMSLQE